MISCEGDPLVAGAVAPRGNKERWQILKEMDGLRKERDRLGIHPTGYKLERYNALNRQIDELQSELTGVQKPKAEKADSEAPRKKQPAASPEVEIVATQVDARAIEEFEIDSDQLLRLGEDPGWRIFDLRWNPTSQRHIIKAERVKPEPPAETRLAISR